MRSAPLWILVAAGICLPVLSVSGAGEGVVLLQLHAANIQKAGAFGQSRPPWEAILVNATAFVNDVEDRYEDGRHPNEPANQVLPRKREAEELRRTSFSTDNFNTMDVQSMWQIEVEKIHQAQTAEEHAHKKLDDAELRLEVQEKRVWQVKREMQEAKEHSERFHTMGRDIQTKSAEAADNESEAHLAFVNAETQLRKYVNKTEELAKSRAALEDSRLQVERQSRDSAQGLRAEHERAEAAQAVFSMAENKKEFYDESLSRVRDMERTGQKEQALARHRVEDDKEAMRVAEEKTKDAASRLEGVNDEKEAAEAKSQLQQRSLEDALLQARKAENRSHVLNGLVRQWRSQESSARNFSDKTDKQLDYTRRLSKELEEKKVSITGRLQKLNGDASLDSSAIKAQKKMETTAHDRLEDARLAVENNTAASYEWRAKEEKAHQNLVRMQADIAELQSNVSKWQKIEDHARKRRMDNQKRQQDMIRAAMNVHKNLQGIVAHE